MIFIRPTFYLYQLLLAYARSRKEPKFKDDDVRPLSPSWLDTYRDDDDLMRGTRPRMKQRHRLSDMR